MIVVNCGGAWLWHLSPWIEGSWKGGVGHHFASVTSRALRATVLLVVFFERGVGALVDISRNCCGSLCVAARISVGASVRREPPTPCGVVSRTLCTVEDGACHVHLWRASRTCIVRAMLAWCLATRGRTVCFAQTLVDVDEH